jgi:uncharacterized protein
MSEFAVVDHPQLSRYEIRVDGEVAGFVRYLRRPDHLDLVHTEIASRFEGRGLARRLVAGVLDDVRANGGRIVASCPYVAAYLRKHPEQADLVAG